MLAHNFFPCLRKPSEVKHNIFSQNNSFQVKYLNNVKHMILPHPPRLMKLPSAPTAATTTDCSYSPPEDHSRPPPPPSQKKTITAFIFPAVTARAEGRFRAAAVTAAPSPTPKTQFSPGQGAVLSVSVRNYDTPSSVRAKTGFNSCCSSLSDDSRGLVRAYSGIIVPVLGPVADGHRTIRQWHEFAGVSVDFLGQRRRLCLKTSYVVLVLHLQPVHHFANVYVTGNSNGTCSLD